MSKQGWATVRRSVWRAAAALILAASVASVIAAARPREKAGRQGQVWQLTYLKAKPGHVAHLAEFIERNWFAMDSAARRAGAIVDYQLVRGAPADSAWDLLEITVFADSTQHARSDSLYRTVFRPAHRVVPVDGKMLPELGTIVHSVTTRWAAGRP